MKVFGAAIDSVKFSSKSEPSSRFFGRLKTSKIFAAAALAAVGAPVDRCAETAEAPAAAAAAKSFEKVYLRAS